MFLFLRTTLARTAACIAASSVVCSCHHDERQARLTTPPRATPAPYTATPAWQLEIQEELSALRGLAFRRPVPYEEQTRGDFRGYVQGELARDLPAAKGSALSRTYSRMGFVPRNFDLKAALEEAYTTQVAAYYDPRTHVFRVLERQRGRDAGSGHGRADEVIAHELVHALQDQHFDLMAYHGEGQSEADLDDDARTARRFVTEGEATFMMLAWQLGSGAGAKKSLGPLTVAGLRMGVAMLAAADLVELLSTIRRGAGAEVLSAEERTAIEATARLPPVIIVPMVEPYYKGALLVSDVWARGGWPAVDDLYRRPPESTEQVLHPVEKLLDRREPPVQMTLPADGPVLAGAELLTTDVLGELGLRIYFKTCKYEGADAVATGWGGDRYWSWQLRGRHVVANATRWDSAEAAARFFEAYGTTLARRFSRNANEDAYSAFDKARASTSNDRFILAHPDGSVITVVRRDLDVDIVDGATADETSALLDVLRRATRAIR